MIILLKRYKKMISFTIIPYLLILGFLTIRTDDGITLSGDLTPVETSIYVEDGYESTGTFNTVFVIGFNRTTLFQRFLGQNLKTVDVSPLSPIQKDISFRDQIKMGQVSKALSFHDSLFAAYQAARNHDASITITHEFKGLIIYYRHSRLTQLDIGDIIIAVDGSSEAMSERIANSDSYVDLTVLRGTNEKNIRITRNEDDEERLYGLRYYNYYDITESHPSYQEIHDANVGGPSGGFMQALSLYNQLVPHDLTRGLKIAGTGTIDLDGDIGPIGGIQQKIVTAHKRGADIFFVPAQHEASAFEAYTWLRNPKLILVIVHTLEDAIMYLENNENFI